LHNYESFYCLVARGGIPKEVEIQELLKITVKIW